VLTTLWGFVQQRLEAHFSRAVTASNNSRDGTRIMTPALNETVLSHDAT
jgi:hypothetical protein